MKQVVTYERAVGKPGIGDQMWLTGKSGHKGGDGDGWTSPVTHVGLDGEFETMHTIYRRKK